jgi:hypothetical protein
MEDWKIKAAAMELRRCIECRSDGDLTGPAVLNLVDALGGDPVLVTEFVGKPALTAAYLVSLLLTQPD